MPKVPKKSADIDRPRHNPLAEDYSPTAPQKPHKSPKRRKLSQADDNTAKTYIDNKASSKILRIGQDLIEEDQAQQDAVKPNPAFDVKSRSRVDADTEAEAADANGLGAEIYEDQDEEWGSASEVEEVELDPADRAIFDKFHPSAADADPSHISLNALSGDANPPNEDDEGPPTDLAALILSKIAEHEAIAPTQADMTDAPLRAQSLSEPEPISPSAVQVYTQIGTLLASYRSGPLPKPFKILPSLSPYHLSRLLDLTSPPNWSPHAHFAAIRIFVSSRAEVATPYLRSILLPKIRDDIRETKRLNLHLYNALKKSLYKPASFFKGVVFPLLEGTEDGGHCTLREAQIISSVLTRVKVPVLHSAAALLRCCDIAAEHFSVAKSDGGGSPTNTFIRSLLEKKYALPYKVIDALVFHFLRFKALKNSVRVEEGYVRLPVLWHQSLLAFAQRYRNDVTEDQREALLDVVAAVGHGEIGKEVRRELLEGRGRGVTETTNGMDVVMEGVQMGGDDTMVGA